MPTPRVLIAEDEPLLRERLCALLTSLWPHAEVVASVGDGEAALVAFDEHGPNVAFLDVRMPGLTGLDVARALAGQCHLVFVTAFDDAAIAAFEAGAVDYLLKPVKPERLQQTVTRLQKLLESPVPAATQVLETLPRGELARLRWVQASVGTTIELTAVDQVLFFRAQEKYTTVGLALGRELLVRMSLKELLPRLDPEQFWQIHRSTLVNLAHIQRLIRDEDGALTVHLKNSPVTLSVSRAFRHRFRQM